jgi:hypothetical protein
MLLFIPQILFCVFGHFFCRSSRSSHAPSNQMESAVGGAAAAMAATVKDGECRSVPLPKKSAFNRQIEKDVRQQSSVRALKSQKERNIF